MSAATPFTRRPTLTSSTISVLLGLAAVWLLIDTDLQRRLLAIAAVGVGLFALGGRLAHRGHVAVGLSGVLIGALAVIGAIGGAAVQPPQFVHRLVIAPAIVGLWILTAALVPVRFRWSRLMLDLGAGVLFVAILTSGVVRGASATALVIAAAATILAWDAAENAVSMGGQMGVDSGRATIRAELVHTGFSGAVAGGAVAVTLGVARLDISGLPFVALVALLVASVTLVLFYHR